MAGERPNPSPVDAFFSSISQRYQGLRSQDRSALENVVIFPGQGIQFSGMGKELAKRDPIVRQMYKQAEKIMPGITEISFNDPEKILDNPQNAQPAIYLYYLACFATLTQSKNSEFSKLPGYFTAHSFGIIPALVAAGSLDFTEGLNIAIERGRITQEACAARPGKMVAVYTSEENPQLWEITQREIEEVVGEAREAGNTDAVLSIAFVNSRTSQIGVGGDRDLVEKVEDRIKKKHRAKGVRTASLDKIGGAFHTELMRSAQPGFREVLGKANIRAPGIPVIFNGQVLETREQIIEALVSQLVEAARFDLTTDRLERQKETRSLEVGEPGVQTNILKRAGVASEVEKVVAFGEMIQEELAKIPPEKIKLGAAVVGAAFVVVATLAIVRRQQTGGHSSLEGISSK